MKNFIFAYLLFFPVLLFGQVEPFKGSNTVVVYSSNTFEDVGKKLIQDGYQIAKSDVSFQTITTEWRSIRYIKYRLIISVMDDKIQFQAKAINEAANGVFNTPDSDWLVDYKKSGVENDIWTAMDVFASNFGTKKEYFKK